MKFYWRPSKRQKKKWSKNSSIIKIFEFWTSSEMSLINCKIELSLTWNQNCVLSTVVDNLTFAITDTKFYAPVVTLKTEDNIKLSKLLSERFKRLVYWNEYKVIPNKKYNANE